METRLEPKRQRQFTVRSQFVARGIKGIVGGCSSFEVILPKRGRGPPIIPNLHCVCVTTTVVFCPPSLNRPLVTFGAASDLGSSGGPEWPGVVIWVCLGESHHQASRIKVLISLLCRVSDVAGSKALCGAVLIWCRVQDSRDKSGVEVRSLLSTNQHL